MYLLFKSLKINKGLERLNINYYNINYIIKSSNLVKDNKTIRHITIINILLKPDFKYDYIINIMYMN